MIIKQQKTIRFINDCACIVDEKEVKRIEPKKLEADKVIAWLVANIVRFEYYVKQFKKDFGL